MNPGAIKSEESTSVLFFERLLKNVLGRQVEQKKKEQKFPFLY